MHSKQRYRSDAFFWYNDHNYDKTIRHTFFITIWAPTRGQAYWPLLLKSQNIHLLHITISIIPPNRQAANMKSMVDPE